MSGWIGVDFDGTLAEYGTWMGPDHCGAPIAPMVERVKRWLSEGREVRIFTARAYPMGRHDADAGRCFAMAANERAVESAAAINAIREWCRQHVGQVLTVTCIKDFSMIELWDDRAVQVRPNTGEVVGHSTRGLS